MKTLQQYRYPLLLAVIVHVIFLTLVFIGLSTTTSQTAALARHMPKVKIVQAVAVDQTKVDAEIKRLRHQREHKRQLQLAHKRARRRELAKLTQQRQVEKLRLQKLKREQQKVLQQRRQAAKKLAQLKQQRLLMQKRQAAAKKRRQKLLAEQQLIKQASAEERQMQKQQHRQLQTVISHYKNLILAAIRQQWLLPLHVKQGAYATLMIKLAPGGTVLSVKIIHSSGDSALDRSARTAVFKASPLPVPKNTQVFQQFRQLQLKVKPEQNKVA